MKVYLYVATFEGSFLGSGVLWAEDVFNAYDQARHLYGVLANISIREDEEQEAWA
jgi:hypothetical protein